MSENRNKVLNISNYYEQTAFFTGESNIINIIFSRRNGLNVFLVQTQIFSCELLWCFYQLFGLSFWRHPFTAEDPLVNKWRNAKFFKIWRNKLIYISDGLRVSIFSAVGELFLWNNTINSTVCTSVPHSLIFIHVKLNMASALTKVCWNKNYNKSRAVRRRQDKCRVTEQVCSSC